MPRGRGLTARTRREAAELSALALAAAQEAGALVAKGYRSRLRVDKKSAADLVTDYDLASEALLRERLSSAVPEASIVGEEGGGDADRELVFYCDPLDGTTNYVHGHPFWAVSVGVADAAGPLAGAVVAPSLGLSWVGYRGGASTRNGEPCSVSRTETLADALLATGFPVDRSRSPENNFDTFIAVKRRARGVRRCGSAAIDLCLVADGTYDAYWERRLKPWDLAGGAAIVLAAGGRLTSLDGSVCRYDVGDVLASNGRLHAALLPLLA